MQEKQVDAEVVAQAIKDLGHRHREARIRPFPNVHGERARLLDGRRRARSDRTRKWAIVKEFILPNLGDGVAQGDVLSVLVKAGDVIKQRSAGPRARDRQGDHRSAVRRRRHGQGSQGQGRRQGQAGPGGAGRRRTARAGAAAPRRRGAEGRGARAQAAGASRGEPPPATSRARHAAEARRSDPIARPPQRRGPRRRSGERRSTYAIAAAGRACTPARRCRGAGRAVTRPGRAGGAVGASPGARDRRRRRRRSPGTGPGGRITQDDVKEFAKQVMSSLGGGGQAAAASGARRRRRRAAARFREVGRDRAQADDRHPPQDRRSI